MRTLSLVLFLCGLSLVESLWPLCFRIAQPISKEDVENLSGRKKRADNVQVEFGNLCPLKYPLQCKGTSGVSCYALENECDGIPDCIDGKDEEECYRNTVFGSPSTIVYNALRHANVITEWGSAWNTDLKKFQILQNSIALLKSTDDVSILAGYFKSVQNHIANKNDTLTYDAVRYLKKSVGSLNSDKIPMIA